jgi:anthranilate phosphoribosyltransferase
LGARIDLNPEQVEACIDQAGIGFMFAQAFHPAMKHVAAARREIGIRTVFNLLGPLTNPAGATCQVIGVPREDLVRTIAAVMQRLGSKRALVVHGDDGFDEISISGGSLVAELTPDGVREFRVTPEDAGLQRHDVSALRGGTPEQNAAELRQVLEGVPGALRDFSLINAAAALVAWGSANDLKAGVRIAAESVDSGGALAKLDAFIAATRAV